MSEWRKICMFSFVQFRKTIFSLRALAVLLAVAPYLYIIIHPIVAMCNAVNVSCAPYLYPFLASDFYTRISICGGAIILLSDAPFIDNNQPYVLMRIGKKNWFLGSIGTIALISLFYIIAINIICLLSILPTISFEVGWGKIITTLSITDAGDFYKVWIYISRYITINYTPWQAILLSCTVSWLVFVFLGLLLFANNIRYNRILGVTICGTFVILSAFTIEAFSATLFYFSPVTWLSIDQMSIDHSTRRPPVLYCLFILVALIFILFIFSYIYIKNNGTNIESDKFEV